MPEINFFWDPLSDNILQERDELGVLTAEYTTEPGLYGNVISQNRGGVESQFHYDALGSTLAVTDDNQQITDTRAYSAFGELTESTGATTFPWQYAGQHGYTWDAATGEYLVRRRLYSPDRIVWLSDIPGSIGRLAPSRAMLNELSPYVYANNRALVFFAPDGIQGVRRDESDTPIMDALGEEERKFIETNCNCKAIIYRTPGKDSEVFGWVGCEKGKMVVRINVLNPDASRRTEYWAKCGFDKCIKMHEQHHIRQAELICPDACKDKSCPAFEKDPPNPRGAAFVISFNEQCGKQVECYAYGTELACAFKVIEDNKKAGRAECKGVAADYLTSWEKYAARNKCAIPKEVKEAIEKAKQG